MLDGKIISWVKFFLIAYAYAACCKDRSDGTSLQECVKYARS